MIWGEGGKDTRHLCWCKSHFPKIWIIMVMAEYLFLYSICLILIKKEVGLFLQREFLCIYAKKLALKDQPWTFTYIKRLRLFGFHLASNQAQIQNGPHAVGLICGKQFYVIKMYIIPTFITLSTRFLYPWWPMWWVFQPSPFIYYGHLHSLFTQFLLIDLSTEGASRWTAQMTLQQIRKMIRSILNLYGQEAGDCQI